MARKIIKKVEGSVILARVRTTYAEAVKKVSEKQCTGKCRAVKPIEEFDRNPCAADGRQSHCKECRTERAAAKRREKRQDNLFAHIF